MVEEPKRQFDVLPEVVETTSCPEVVHRTTFPNVGFPDVPENQKSSAFQPFSRSDRM
jgi:hypothetical protein